MHPGSLIRITSWPLAASLFMNLALVGALIVLWQARMEPTTMLPPPPTPTMVKAAEQVKPARQDPTLSALKAAPFHWRQLDAPDFPTFVKNLRAIGCPEATIHDIIQGELSEVYATKRQEIEREIAAAPSQSRAPLEQQLKQLSAEETAMLSATMNGSASQATPANHAAAATQTTSSVQGQMPAAAPAAKTASTLTPVAFLAGNDPNQPTTAGTLAPTPTDPRLNAATAGVISQMRSDFATSLQNVTADPSSQVYRQRWMTAQRASDEQFSSMFGGDNFIKTQVEAVRAGTNAAATPAKP